VQEADLAQTDDLDIGRKDMTNLLELVLVVGCKD
jgi:hypothetical protein